MKSKKLPSYVIREQGGRSRKYEGGKKQKCYLCQEILLDMWELKIHQDLNHKEFFDQHEEFYSEWTSLDVL